uniref:2-deoxy-5-keto-D-gluconate 6-phosphate aldolase domain-containing protein n=1 Tax=Pseudomonas sp. TaxID=306 RepID=UPI00258A708D
GVVLLGLNAPASELAEGFAQAAASTTCRGFAVGRTIFHEPSRAWFNGEIDDAGLVAQVRQRFSQLIEAWRSARHGR